MATLTFFKYERVIQVDSPQTSVGIQDLINQIRNYEEELINLDYGTIANAYGKQTLGGGAFIGITLELINNWRLSFEARPGPDTVLCTVSGGNLVAINDYDNNPIYPTAFTQVNIAQSTSPSIIQAPTDYATLYMLESLRGRNKSVGSIWYWNPTSGSDTNDGTTPGTAVLTFAKAQDLATAGAGDIIFALATSGSGITSTGETINITKAALKLRGPGYAFQIIPLTSGSPTATISADGAEMSGFYLTTAAGGTDNGITVTGDSALIQDIWIQSATGNGIDISTSARSSINTCAIENCTGNGINIGATTTLSNIAKCIITGNANGVSLAGSGVSDNILETNLIYNNTGDGIGIASGVTRTGIRLLHTLAGNGTNINDAGTGTFQDTSGTITPGDIDAIVNGVWDEVIGTHVTAGTTGKTLKDAKTKATLASLK
jgi:hypothetical protein